MFNLFKKPDYSLRAEIAISNKDFSRAVECYKKMIKAGDGEGYHGLGTCYLWGMGVEQSHAEAFNCFQKAVEKKPDYVMSYTFLGDFYRFGWNGFSVDYDKMMEYYGKTEEIHKDTYLALLGDCYRLGLGVEKDHKKALEYYQSSHSMRGVCGRAWYYENGLGVEKDIEKADKDYSLAARNFTSAESMYRAAMFYRNVKLDIEKAEEYMKYARICDYPMEKTAVSCSKEELFERTKEKADAVNDRDALLEVCKAYLHGNGCKQSFQNAFSYALRIINMDFEDAVDKIQLPKVSDEAERYYDQGLNCYYSGYAYKKAADYFEMAAQGGHVEAMRMAGYLCSEVINGHANEYSKKGEMWNRKACECGNPILSPETQTKSLIHMVEKGHPEAMITLAKLYSDKEELKKDGNLMWTALHSAAIDYYDRRFHADPSNNTECCMLIFEMLKSQSFPNYKLKEMQPAYSHNQQYYADKAFAYHNGRLLYEIICYKEACYGLKTQMKYHAQYFYKTRKYGVGDKLNKEKSLGLRPEDKMTYGEYMRQSPNYDIEAQLDEEERFVNLISGNGNFTNDELMYAGEKSAGDYSKDVLIRDAREKQMEKKYKNK